MEVKLTTKCSLRMIYDLRIIINAFNFIERKIFEEEDILNKIDREREIVDLINLSISSLPSTWKFTNQSTSPLIRNLEEIARGRKYCEERRRRKGRSIENKNIRLSGEKILWFHRKINSRGISFPREMGRDNKWRIIARNTINPWSTFYIFPFERNSRFLDILG